MRGKWRGATWTVQPRFYRVRFLDKDNGLLSEHSLHALHVEHAAVAAWNDAEPEVLEKTRKVDVDELVDGAE